MSQNIIMNRYVNQKHIRLLSISIFIFCLSGCGVHKASFDCSGSKGMGCGSMIGVHKAIKNDEFPKESDQPQIKKTSNGINTSNNQAGTFFSTNNEGERIFRSQDKIMRIWFNGYFDGQNNFHDSRYVYTIISPAKWILTQ